jgi:hypothetical protein
MRTKYLLSSLLMAAGIVLVFYGFSSALGFTVTGTLASVAAIAALLYAGGVIFGSAPERHADAVPSDPAVAGEKRRGDA